MDGASGEEARVRRLYPDMTNTSGIGARLRRLDDWTALTYMCIVFQSFIGGKQKWLHDGRFLCILLGTRNQDWRALQGGAEPPLGLSAAETAFSPRGGMEFCGRVCVLVIIAALLFLVDRMLGAGRSLRDESVDLVLGLEQNGAGLDAPMHEKVVLGTVLMQSYWRAVFLSLSSFVCGVACDALKRQGSVSSSEYTLHHGVRRASYSLLSSANKDKAFWCACIYAARLENDTSDLLMPVRLMVSFLDPVVNEVPRW